MEYVVAVLIPSVVAVIVVILAKRIASHHFKCKHCSMEFQFNGQGYLLRSIAAAIIYFYALIVKPKIGVLNNLMIDWYNTHKK